ncbi:MAG TPA: hypothetical protein VF594_10940, partial [Rubricoccaceae bacterium]
QRLSDALVNATTAAQRTALRTALTAQRGQSCDVLGLLADSLFPARLRTHAEMDAAGWFTTSTAP